MQGESAWPVGTSLVIYIITLAVSIVAAVLIVPLGLAVPEFAVWPLAVVFGAYIAALAAAWIANLLADDGRRSNVFPIVIVSIITSLLVGVGSLILIDQMQELNRTLALLACMAIISIIITVLAFRYRSYGRSLRYDLVVTILLIFIGIAGVAATVVTVCSFERCVA